MARLTIESKMNDNSAVVWLVAILVAGLLGWLAEEKCQPTGRTEINQPADIIELRDFKGSGG